MPVRSVTWVARTVSGDALDGTRRMANALGLEVLSASATQVVLRTIRGDVLEYCSPAHPESVHLFAHGDTVIGFEVDDISATGAALEAGGFRWLTDTIDAGPVRYRHFLGPEGCVYGLVSPIACSA